MFDPFSGWSRLVTAGFSMTNTSMRAFETLKAANEVIAARTKIMNAAVYFLPAGGQPELARMVP